MIRILIIELLNTILLLVCLIIKSLLKKFMVCLENARAFLGVGWVEKGWKPCNSGMRPRYFLQQLTDSVNC
jgi:hypothetical protein